MTNTKASTRGRWKLSPLPTNIAEHIDSLVRKAARDTNREDFESAWRLLQDAHILSQPWTRPHLRVHLAMLSLGWQQRERAEVVGQVARLIVAGPGSALGRYPAGNTGRANVSAFKPMPIRDDLASLLSDADQPGADVHSRQTPKNGITAVWDNAALYRLTGWVGGIGLKTYARRRKPIDDPAAVQERQLLQLVNEAKDTTFGHDHHFAEISNIHQLGQVLRALGVDQPSMAIETASMNQYAWAKTTSRSIVGSMTDVIKHIEYREHILDQMTLTELALELARTPCRAGRSNSIWPDNETRSVFGSSDAT